MKKLIVVTGGTKGIGKAIIQRFASEGFDIATCARSGKDLKALEKELKQSHASIDVIAHRADLSKKEDVKSFLSALKSRKVDLLVNNTGVFLPGQIHREKPGTLEKMIETNLYSAYHISRGLIPAMIRRKSGNIFNICSTASITPYVNGGSYCISKFALYGMTKVLREEMKEHNIRVTAVLPGATLTSSWEGVDLPSERFMKPEDVADAIWGVYNLSGQSVVEEILIRPQLGDI
ncbi:MAG TPA: SDR family oxidoreductase [Cytophagaceae bacterium]|jgi:short-subunit dehydrogenase|nr:SDR family oxidoreductase [Cytophagaceae bacterium]